MAIRPSQEELDRLFNVIREQMETRLASYGYMPGDTAPAEVVAEVERQAFEGIQGEAIMPDFTAALSASVTQLRAKIAVSKEPSNSPNERLIAAAEVQTAIEEDPVLKGFLLDERAAFSQQLEDLKPQFRAAVKF